MALDWSQGELERGLRRYRAEEFFLAHEHWEAAWLQLREPEKTFLQALIQVAAAFHHFQRGNREGTRSLLLAALRKLDSIEASIGGIDRLWLCDGIREWLTALEDGGPASHPPFAEIRPEQNPRIS